MSPEWGAWYGSGPTIPDGQLCVIFCSNQRLFLADKRCNDTGAGDFREYNTYTRNGETVHTSSSKIPSFQFVIAGSQARLSFNQFRDLPLQQVAPNSPLCTDPSIQPSR